MNSISERSGSASIFWPLTRHEIRLKGSWRKKNSLVPLKWWIFYIAIIVVVGFAAMFFIASEQKIDLGSFWFATIGFPYWIFFIGYSMIKREWENDSYGWWLTLPYSRTKLVSAKWTAALIRTVLIIAAVLLLGTLFCILLAVFLGTYTFADAGSFVLRGIPWIALIIGFSPLLLSIGIFTASIFRSTWRAATPILWVLFMGGGSLIYGSPLFQAIFKSTDVPFSSTLLILMLISWVLAWGFIKLSAWLLDKQLSI